MSHQKQEQYWIRLLYRVIWLDKNATKWYIVSLHWYNFSSWLYHTDTLSQYIIKHFMSELRSFEIILISSFCIINKWIKMLFVNKILIFLQLFNILTNWKNIWASECCPWRWNFHGQYCRPSLHTDLVEFCEGLSLAAHTQCYTLNMNKNSFHIIDLPLSRVSKQILKHDCIISHTDSFVMWAPTGVRSKVRRTWSMINNQNQ